MPARGKARSALHTWAGFATRHGLSEIVTNQSAFLSPESSGRGSQFKELCLTHFFLFPKGNGNLKTLKAPPTLPKQKSIPRAHSVQSPGRAEKNNIQSRKSMSCLLSQSRGSATAPGHLEHWRLFFQPAYLSSFHTRCCIFHSWL